MTLAAVWEGVHTRMRYWVGGLFSGGSRNMACTAANMVFVFPVPAHPVNTISPRIALKLFSLFIATPTPPRRLRIRSESLNLSVARVDNRFYPDFFFEISLTENKQMLFDSGEYSFARSTRSCLMNREVHDIAKYRWN
jgi:hypothetical protein